MMIAPRLVKCLTKEFPETHYTLDFDLGGTTLPKVMAGQIDLMLGAFYTPAAESIQSREWMRSHRAFTLSKAPTF